MSDNYLATYQIGQGRAVVFNSFPVRAYPWQDSEFVSWDQRVDPEYMMAELGRSLLWAGGKEPQVEIVGTPPARWDIPWGQSKGQTGGWLLNVLGPKRDLTVSWRVRDLQNQVWLEERKTVAGAEGQIEVPCTLPDLGAGAYYLDVFIDGPQGRENYGYSGIRVATPYKVAFKAERLGVEPGTPIRDEAMVQPVEGQENLPHVTSLLLKLVDNEDRVLDQQTLNMRVNAPVPFTFQTDPFYSTQLRVIPEVVAEGRSAAAYGYQAYNQLKRRQDQFNVLIWGEAGGAYGFYGWRRAWRTGLTVSQGPKTWANLAYSPCNFSLRDVTPKPDPATGVLTLPQGCWNDPEQFGKYLDTLDKVWQGGTQAPVWVYDMSDEGPHSGCDLHPRGVAAYQDWLREQYQDDLDALNQEWGSQYTAWEDVTVLDPTDNMETKARDAGHYARWSDRKHWAEVNFARNVIGAEMKRARQFDPQALVGFEGAGAMWGIDYDELLANSGFTGMYRGIALEMLRSLAPRGYPYGYWMGYSSSGERCTRAAWDQVIQGANSLWYFIFDYDWFGPNNEPYPDRQEFIDNCVLPLRRGLGNLLMRMEMPHDGLGVYYSVAACHASELSDSAKWNSNLLATENTVLALQDLGYQWVFTTKPRMLAGDLQKRGIKVLFLPFIQPLGEDEVEALTRFVQQGGTVIADQRPGVMSGHCRPWENGPADRLFGIHRTGPGNPVRIQGRATTQFLGQPLPLLVHNANADADLKAGTAVPGATLDGQPVFLVNKLGKGQAILLNFHLTQYTGHRDMARGQEVRDFLRALMGALNIKPRLGRTAPKGEELTYTQTATWNEGNVWMYALYKTDGDPTPVEVVLPQKRFVFDLSEGEKGNTDRVQVSKLLPGHAHFLATYPYDPGRPVIRPSATSAQSGETVNFQIAMSGVPGNEKGVFSFYTRLVNPRGEWVDVIPWSVQGQGGKAMTRVRFAYNDMPGDWTLQVREITTGRGATATVQKK
ncbi:MAG: hypothetical protein GX100_02065 [candidate division WS1 bacterium]|nr:hypothetical protein [candidate division WS1 bacterium]